MSASPFAHPIKDKRDFLNLTQIALADLADVSRVTVTRIERGQGVHTDSLLAVLVTERLTDPGWRLA